MLVYRDCLHSLSWIIGMTILKSSESHVDAHSSSIKKNHVPQMSTKHQWNWSNEYLSNLSEDLENIREMVVLHYEMKVNNFLKTIPSHSFLSVKSSAAFPATLILTLWVLYPNCRYTFNHPSNSLQFLLRIFKPSSPMQRNNLGCATCQALCDNATLESGNHASSSSIMF